jgi:hypothetical protein
MPSIFETNSREFPGPNFGKIMSLHGYLARLDVYYSYSRVCARARANCSLACLLASGRSCHAINVFRDYMQTQAQTRDLQASASHPLQKSISNPIALTVRYLRIDDESGEWRTTRIGDLSNRV